MIKFEFDREMGRIESVSFLTIKDKRICGDEKIVDSDVEKDIKSFLSDKKCRFKIDNNPIHTFDDYFWIYAEQGINRGDYAYVGCSMNKATIIVSDYYDTYDAVKCLTQSPKYDLSLFCFHAMGCENVLYTYDFLLEELDDRVKDKISKMKKMVSEKVFSHGTKIVWFEDFSELYNEVLECFKLLQYKYE